MSTLHAPKGCAAINLNGNDTHYFSSLLEALDFLGRIDGLDIEAWDLWHESWPAAKRLSELQAIKPLVRPESVVELRTRNINDDDLDRKRFPRYSIADQKIVVSSQGHVEKIQVCDISLGGIQLKSPLKHSIRLDSIVAVMIESPYSKDPLKIYAKVMVDQHQQQTRLKFIDMGDLISVRLKRWMENLKACQDLVEDKKVS